MMRLTNLHMNEFNSIQFNSSIIPIFFNRAFSIAFFNILHLGEFYDFKNYW